MAKMDPEEVQKRLLREAAEEALANASDNDPAVAEWLDADLDKGMTEILGMSPSQLQKALNADIPGLTQKEINEAIRDAKAARKALEGGGWLGGKPDPKLAERILMRNGKIVELGKKRKKGCAVIAVLLLGIGASTIGAAVYGAAEIISALH